MSNRSRLGLVVARGIRSGWTLVPLLALVACGASGGGSTASEPAANTDPAAPREELRSVSDGKHPTCSTFGGTVSGGDCGPDQQLFKESKDACAADGLVLNEFSGDDACAEGLSMTYTYVCCTAKPKCSTGTVDPGQCVSQTSLFDTAESACGGAVAKFTPVQGSCPNGHGSSASYMCGCE